MPCPGLLVLKLEQYGVGGRYVRNGCGIWMDPTEVTPRDRRGESKEPPSDGLENALPTRPEAGCRFGREAAGAGLSMALWLK